MRSSITALCATALLGACRTGPLPVTESEVRALLDTQAAAWNRGDIPAFMVGYWRSPDLSFVGSDGLRRGYAAVEARYLTAYPDAAARGALSFEVIEVRPLGCGNSLVIGSYHLERAEPADGTFTLLLQRRSEGVRVVHDHTSEANRDGG